ncbi:long chain fatty alcohol oxidase [Pseudohyphozyma bogoriensis]|nr:long chain fatty alcohol oxidase [Pseudohyphozyma bogoriensis]
MSSPPSPFNESQRAVLVALCDAVFSGHDGEEAAKLRATVPKGAPKYQLDKVEHLIRSSFSDLPGSVDALAQQLKTTLSPTNFDQIPLTLTLLSTRAGTFVLTGHLKPFLELTRTEREQVLKDWTVSKLSLRRKAARAFACIGLFVIYTNYDDCALATGYPALGDPARGLDAKRNRSHHPYVFESISSSSQYVETDVLVIGSGAGGGVVSSELAKKGWRTLVLEKGTYVKPEDMVATPKNGLKELFEKQGLFISEDGGINILAGATFGGGTTINWSASLAPQHFIRETWAKEHGLRHFLSPQFTQSIDFVQQRMGVSTSAIQHNKPNQILVSSAKKLGYHIDNIPQNTNGNPHPCGFCSFGCASCEKQGGTVTWLQDAAEAGARFMVGATVEQLLFAASSTSPKPTLETLDNFTPTTTRRRCIGALVKSSTGALGIVLAKEAVVVSGGSLNSPAILIKSGLKGHRIGKNLRLHPVSAVTGYYDEVIKPWEGSIMTAVSNVRENREGTHHGCKLEVMMSFPGGSAASFQPWKGSIAHKEAMLNFNHAFTLIAISRDRGSGSVIVDETGISRVDYVLDPFDGLSMLGGVIAGAEVHLVAGARRISTAQAGVEDYIPEEGHQFLNDPKWEKWIAKVRQVGIHPTKAGIGSAHQMGSCQMGTSPVTSAVDPRGRVWGTQGLYVADASVFPTASAVNPMITTMAVSHSIAQFINEDLQAAAAEPASAHL